MQLGKTVRELLRDADSAELTYWEAYSQLEPFGPAQDDFRAAVAAKLEKPGAVFPSLRAGNRPRQTPEQMRAAVRMATGKR